MPLLQRLSFPPTQSPELVSDLPPFFSDNERKAALTLLERRLITYFPASLFQSSQFIMSTHNSQAYFLISQIFIEPLLYAKYSASSGCAK